MRIKIADKYPRALMCFPGMHIPLITEISIFDYATIPPGPFLAPMHLHHYHQMDVVLGGEIIVSFKDAPSQKGHTGDAWLIPPLVWHQIESENGYRQASFKFTLAPRFWPYFGKEFCRFKVTSALLECLENAGQRGAQQALAASQQIAAVATLCLTQCLDQLQPINIPDNQLDNFHQQLWPLLERIQQHPTDNWTVARMAAECNLSLAHFSRRFHRVVRQSPQQYVRETCLKNSAAELLAAPQLPIKEIAARAGYSSVHAFTHAFTQIFKISPAVYRNQAAKETDF
jgi:AraC-like DNA-binding protein